MTPEVQVAIVAGAVTALGWLVVHTLQVRAARVGHARESLLAHTERQLEELYGPLAFLIYEGRQTFNDLLKSLGRTYVFVEGKPLPENELKTWLFWADHDFLPRNARIKALLTAKTHLIDGEVMPESFVAFLNHCNSWHINHLRWEEERVEYSWHSAVAWPDDFERDVIDSFTRLKRRHDGLLRALGRE